MGIVLGCHHDDVSSSLRQAEKLIADNPHDAVEFLSHLQDSMQHMSTDDKMYCRLLFIKATDKAYMPLKDIEGIQRIVKYYENNDNRTRLPMAYYYAGRTYIENQDAFSALNYFLKAEDLLADGEDDHLYTVLCSQIADIYAHRQLFDEARFYLHKAYLIDSIARDTFSMVSDLNDEAVIYTWDDNEEESLRLLRRAHAMAQQAESLHLMVEVEKNIAYNFRNLQKYDSALYYIRRPSQHLDLVNKGQVYSLIATVYQAMHQLDSAERYAKELLDLPLVHHRNTAHKVLTEVALTKGDQTNALEHLHRHFQLEDTADMIRNTEAIAHAKEWNDHQRQEQENTALRIKSNTWKITALTIISLLLIVSASFAIWTINRRRKHLVMQLRYVHMQKLFEHNRESYEKILTENKDKIADLEEQLKHTATKNELLTESINQQELRLKNENTITQSQINIHNIQTQSIRDTDSYKDFYRLLSMGDIPTDEQWVQLETTLNQTFDNFIPRLEHVKKLSETEKRVCMLLKIEMRPSHIATLMCKQPNTIASIRSRLSHKFCLDKVTSSSWDTFIMGM